MNSMRSSYMDESDDEEKGIPSGQVSYLPVQPFH